MTKTPVAEAAIALPITAEGFYPLSDEQYHSDPCLAPSLSRGVLLRLMRRTPRHAWAIHPKLGMAGRPMVDNNSPRDIGTVAHDAFLLQRYNLKEVVAENWQTDRAKDARFEAREAGLIPLLTRQYDRAMHMVDALETFRKKTGAFTQGKPEVTAIWREGYTWCRSRIDWLPEEQTANPWDLKTTDGSAHISSWSRVCFQNGADLQDAFYCRGIERLRHCVIAPMKFCVIEQNPPYGICVYEMSKVTRGLAEQDVEAGLDLWRACFTSGEFPSYPITTQYIDPPGWQVRNQIEAVEVAGDSARFLRGDEHANGVRYIETGNFGG
jgi:PDDEXK-like domain of unknown function (DUF3799)